VIHFSLNYDPKQPTSPKDLVERKSEKTRMISIQVLLWVNTDKYFSRFFRFKSVNVIMWFVRKFCAGFRVHNSDSKTNLWTSQVQETKEILTIQCADFHSTNPHPPPSSLSSTPDRILHQHHPTTLIKTHTTASMLTVILFFSTSSSFRLVCSCYSNRDIIVIFI